MDKGGNDLKPTPSIRKMKFAPKRPTQKKPQPPKLEETSRIKEEPVDTDLLLQMKTAKNNAAFGSRRMPTPTDEKVKANPDLIAFGATTSSYKIFGASASGLSSKAEKSEKEYVFPWDESINYPITLPLRDDRRDPKILNEEEFGGSAVSSFAKGTELDSASKLGLNIKSDIPQMMFFQLPAVLPVSKPDMEASGSKDAKKGGCKLRDLSAGYVGKLLVYKSGKVKMKFGDNLFDVFPGSDCIFSQDVAVVNLKDKQCCVIGQLGKERAIVTPDVHSMLDS